MKINIRENISFREMEKNDYPIIMRYIGEAKKHNWEYEKNSTKKRLEKVYLYSYLLKSNNSMVAVYRGQVIGIILVAKSKKQCCLPVNALKRSIILLLLRLTKEGRTNIKNCKKILEMGNKLLGEMNENGTNRILFLYTNSNYDRKYVETKLLDSVLSNIHGKVQIVVEQKSNNSFFEEYGFEKISEKIEMMEINNQRFRQKLALFQYSID